MMSWFYTSKVKLLRACHKVGLLDNDFKYTPFRDGHEEFRLLTLEPGPWDAEIRCKLEHVSFSDVIEYEALSYVWGDQKQTTEIWLGRHRHAVTTNLGAALRQLRYTSKPRVLWVDALCINQADIAEKEMQLLRMGAIYADASKVLAWTGSASKDSDEAMDALETFGKWMNENEDLVFRAPEDSVSPASIADRVESLGFPLESQNWECIWQFLDRKYWTRAWIIQELAIRGKGEWSEPCTIICGKRQMDKAVFETACIGILALILPLENSAVSMTPGDVREPLRSMMLRGRGHPPGLAMCQTVWAANPDGRKPRLHWLLTVTWRFDATDDRDKIYALLGLVDEHDRAVKPSCKKSTSEVLMDYVEFHVKRDKNLESIVSNRSQKCSVRPSWTPELHKDHHAHELILQGEYNAALYNASASREAVIEIDKQRKTLKARGILLGTVETVLGPWLEGTETSQRLSSPMEWTQQPGRQDFIQGLRNIGNTISDNHDAYDTFWRTLVANRAPTVPGEDSTFRAPSEMRIQSRMFFGIEGLPDQTLPLEVKWRIFQEQTGSFLASMSQAIANRTFVKLTDGRMGLGPYLAQTGDVIAILYGSRIPFVLRSSSGDMYEVVGCAYIHGIMNGEMFDSDTVAEQDFELC